MGMTVGNGFQALHFPLLKRTKQGNERESWRSWPPCTRCYKHTAAPASKRLFQSRRAAFLHAHRPEASSPTFRLLSFTGKAQHHHHFQNPPHALQSSHCQVWSLRRSLGTILLGFSLFRWAHVTHCCGQGLSWAALRHRSNGHKLKNRLKLHGKPSPFSIPSSRAMKSSFSGLPIATATWRTCAAFLFHFPHKHAKSHWQMSDIKKEFCPKQRAGCTSSPVARHGLWLYRNSCPAPAFSSPRSCSLRYTWGTAQQHPGCWQLSVGLLRVPRQWAILLFPSPGGKEMRWPVCLTGKVGTAPARSPVRSNPSQANPKVEEKHASEQPLGEKWC